MDGEESITNRSIINISLVNFIFSTIVICSEYMQKKTVSEHKYEFFANFVLITE